MTLKQPRHKKVLGIALGERSLLAAELLAADRPQVKRLAELVYPEGISLSQPAELAKVLAHFLKDNQFATRAAVVGIPLKWLVVKTKEVPPANDATVAQLLRLEAEAEFSTELKDLVYDFSSAAPEASQGDASHGDASHIVLLVATQKKYIDSIEILCEGARLVPLAVTPSAMALGSLTGSSLKRDVLVLSVGSGGVELSSQSQSSATAMRNVRAGDLRAAVRQRITPGGFDPCGLRSSAGTGRLGRRRHEHGGLGRAARRDDPQRRAAFVGGGHR